MVKLQPGAHGGLSHGQSVSITFRPKTAWPLIPCIEPCGRSRAIRLGRIHLQDTTSHKEGTKTMLNLKIALGFAATLTAGIALATTAQARDLAVVSWGGAYQDAQKKVYFEPFKKATGVPMNDESWDGGIGVLRAKVQGGAATWDVVQVESDELAVGCEEGLFEKTEYSKIGGEAAYLPPSINSCGVGAIVYDFVLGYDKDKLRTRRRAGPTSSTPRSIRASAACVRVRRPRWRLPSSPTVSRRRTSTSCWPPTRASSAPSRSWTPSRKTLSGGRPVLSRRSCSLPANWR